MDRSAETLREQQHELQGRVGVFRSPQLEVKQAALLAEIQLVLTPSILKNFFWTSLRRERTCTQWLYYIPAVLITGGTAPLHLNLQKALGYTHDEYYLAMTTVSNTNTYHEFSFSASPIPSSTPLFVS